MYAALLVLKMYGYRGRFGIDINPERIPVEVAIALNVNALRAACEIINNLDFERLVETMYDPTNNRGVVEDVMTRALAPPQVKLVDIRRALS